MKKGANIELKKNNPLKNVAEKSKVKTKNIKKSNKPLKNTQKENLKNPSQLQKSNTKEKKEKNKKGPKQPPKTEKIVEKTEPEILDPNELAKIEKKKAKKLAKKLKKKEKKEQEKNQKEQAKTTPINGSLKKSAQKDAKGNVVREPLEDAATVFIGNLPTNTKRVQLVKLFKKYGTVKAIRFRTASGNVLFKHKQRKKAGSLNAYVSLTEIEAAKKSLELNGFEFNGNHLRVTPSTMAQNRNEHDVKRTVFVGNLKYTANSEKLHEIFSNCGEIDYIRCLTDGEDKCKGVAYVCFKSAEAVGLALELKETLLDERPIHVERYTLKKQGAKEARDKQDKSQQKKPQFTGARKRIDDKKSNLTKKAKNTDDNKDKKKKSEFRGVKVTGIKKKGKKKTTNEMKNLAKKIAPKIKKGK